MSDRAIFISLVSVVAVLFCLLVWVSIRASEECEEKGMKLHCVTTGGFYSNGIWISTQNCYCR